MMADEIIIGRTPAGEDKGSAWVSAARLLLLSGRWRLTGALEQRATDGTGTHAACQVMLAARGIDARIGEVVDERCEKGPGMSRRPSVEQRFSPTHQ
jgi:hypothetical protein